MQRREIKSFLSLLFFLVIASAVLAAQTDGAMLYAKGNVTLNGQSVGNSTSIFVGDRLEIADSSVGSINRHGSSVVLSPNSSIQYRQSGIELLKGEARVSTIQGLSAHTGQVTVTPASGTAKFDVVKLDDNRVMVSSREGNLRVYDGSHTITVQSGAHQILTTGTNPMDASGPQRHSSEIRPAAQPVSDPFYTVGPSLDDSPNVNPCPAFKFCRRPNVSQHKPCRCPQPG